MNMCEEKSKSVDANDEASCIWINLTPHDIHFVDANGMRYQTVTATGMIARVNTWSETIGTVNGVPYIRTVYGDVMGLPEPKAGVLYLVSSLVCEHTPGRNDLYYPTAIIKDDFGKIIGARAISS
jgi:hypothetical protein